MAITRPIIAGVDDDAAVRNSLKFSLEIDGFSIRTYASAEELLGSGNLDNFQCLVVDQDMPRMTGLELVTALRAQGVKVPALLICGRLTPAVTRQASVAGIPVVEKRIGFNPTVEAIAAQMVVMVIMLAVFTFVMWDRRGRVSALEAFYATLSDEQKAQLNSDRGRHGRSWR